MGSMMFDPIWAERVHVSDRCELLHVIRGTVRLEMAPRTFVGGVGATLLVPPHTAHRDRFDLREGLEVIYCAFMWPRTKAYLEVVHNADLLRLTEPQKAEVGILFDQLRSDRGGMSTGDLLVTRVRLLSVLLLLLRGVVSCERQQPEPGTGRRALMQRAKAFIAGNYQKPVSLDMIAAA
ncbi:MAG: hypothetical protein GX592_13405, partial [Clostridiales bacterium]|nr:hypothetical protein [Clostridiales bacterium]